MTATGMTATGPELRTKNHSRGAQKQQSIQYTFSADNPTDTGKLYRGASPSNEGTQLSTDVMPEGFPMTISPERREEFTPGLDPDLLAVIQATAEVEIKDANNPEDPTGTKQAKDPKKTKT